MYLDEVKVVLEPHLEKLWHSEGLEDVRADSDKDYRESMKQGRKIGNVYGCGGV